MGSMYPTLPSVSAMSDMSAAAPSSGLAPAFDADARRRYSGNLLQKAAPARHESDQMDISDDADDVKASRRSSEQENLHHTVNQLAIHSPKVDPALSMRSPSGTIERLRAYLKERLEAHDFADEEEDVKHEDESRMSDDARDLYPVLRAVQEGRE